MAFKNRKTSMNAKKLCVVAIACFTVLVAVFSLSVNMSKPYAADVDLGDSVIGITLGTVEPRQEGSLEGAEHLTPELESPADPGKGELSDGYARNQVLVSFQQPIDEESILGIFADTGLNVQDAKILSAQQDGTQALAQVMYGGPESPFEAARKVSENEHVASAEPNFARTLDAASGEEELSPTTSTLLQVALTPNDPGYSSQWGLQAVGAPAAWAQRRTDGNVTVAVIDTGVNCDHPDLASNLVLSNCAKDVVAGTVGKAAVNDLNGHGTHVAGIIGAVANNALGVAGVSFNAKVLPIKVTSGSDGTVYTSDIIKAIDYVISLKTSVASPDYLKNIRVINLSLGSYGYSSYERAAIQRAIDAGILVVASAGNEATSSISYPSGYPSVIGVSALKDAGSGNPTFDSEYSNYGDAVDLAAPGTDILSTAGNGDYESMDGTSMAAPFVSGAAALVFAANMSYTPAQVESILENSADDLGSAGWDQYYGYGALRVDSALKNREAIKAVTRECAVLRNDGSVWKCASNGNPVSDRWSNADKGNVRTLYIAPDVTNIPNEVYVDRSCSISLHFGNLETVQFLTDQNGKNACSSIESGAFGYCGKLTRVANFEKTRVSTIGSNAFYHCSKLESISAPSTLASVQGNAFNGCSSLKSIYGLAATKLSSVGDGAFSYCEKLASLDFPTSTIVIGQAAFSNCTSLAKVTLPSSALVSFGDQNPFAATPLDSSSSNKAYLYVPGKLIPEYKTSISGYGNWTNHLAAIPGTDVFRCTWHSTITYTGKAVSPGISVTRNGSPLKSNTDYFVSFQGEDGASIDKNSLVNVGNYKAVVTYKGDKRTDEVRFKIAPASIKGAKLVLAHAKVTYNGKARKPSVKTVGGKTLVEGKDYAISCSAASPKNAGSYKLKVTGKGNYTGTSAAAVFKIVKASNRIKAKNYLLTLKGKKAGKARALAKAKTIKLESKAKVSARTTVKYAKANKAGGKKITVSKAGKVTLKKGLKSGTYKVKIKLTARASKNYKAARAKKIVVTVRVK